ncbi:unnamed protein product [Caretta caretta]
MSQRKRRRWEVHSGSTDLTPVIHMAITSLSFMPTWSLYLIFAGKLHQLQRAATLRRKETVTNPYPQ